MNSAKFIFFIGIFVLIFSPMAPAAFEDSATILFKQPVTCSKAQRILKSSALKIECKKNQIESKRAHVVKNYSKANFSSELQKIKALADVEAVTRQTTIQRSK